MNISESKTLCYCIAALFSRTIKVFLKQIYVRGSALEVILDSVATNACLNTD